MTESNLHPLTISLHKQSKFLEIVYDDGASFKLPCEYLRVFSPSADVKGHGPGQEVLQTGKETVNISKIEPVGNYAIQIFFDDGHSSGIYSWDYLYELGSSYNDKWHSYLKKLEEAGYKRNEQ